MNIKANSGNSIKPKKKKGIIAAIIAGAVIVVLAGGTTAAGFYINKLDTIYPNVMIGGVNLSGMTVDEAKEKLSDAGYEQKAANIAVTVSFPDGEKMMIAGEQPGFMLQSEAAANIAYEYGRNGSFFSNELTYIKSLFSKLNLDNSSVVRTNEDYIRGTVNDFIKTYNKKIIKDVYTVTPDSIEIIKGSGKTLVDGATLYDLVVASLYKSLEQNASVAVDYSVGTNGGAIDLQSIYDNICVKPVEAVYDTINKKITQSATGVGFDVAAAQKAFDAAQDGETVMIPLIITEPQVTTEQLKSLLFHDLLSEKKTYVAGTSNRIHNVALAASTINGKILNPGETFSYNETLGERTTAKGYLEAGAYVGGKVVQEIGGGICQMSSTLYSCVLYGNLEVVERSNHMFIVTYLPLGVDATVNWGSVDFKFKNNTDYPIEIESLYKDGYLTVKLHGTKPNTNYVKIESIVISTTDFKTVKREDPTIAPGATKEDTSGHKGYVVDTYKYIYNASGEVLSKTFIARSAYRVQDKVILVPVGTLTPPSPSDTGTSDTTPDTSPSAVSPSPSNTPASASPEV